MRGKKEAAALDVVEAVAQQSRQAAELAGIAGQERLIDPRLNPATRPHADRLRDEQQHRDLDAAAARSARRHRVADARAAEAERTLEALALARRTSSPARSVLALHSGRRVYGRLALGASAVLAAGSAMGLEAAASAMDAPTGTGYIAELGLTVLSTVAISVRAMLAEHRVEVKHGTWQAWTLWVLMTVPLLASIATNLAMTNSVGAACSIGAAAFGLLGIVVADRASAGMQARAAEVDAADEAQLRAVALAEDLPVVGGQAAEAPAIDAATAPRRPDERERPRTRTRTREDGPQDQDGGHDADLPEGEAVAAGVAADPVAALAERGAAELAEWLADQDGPDGGVRPTALPGPSGHGPQGAAATALDAAAEAGADPSAEPVRTGAHIDTDQDEREDEPDAGEAGPDREGPERVLPAIEARRAMGASTRQRIAEYLSTHPAATVGQIAADLDLSRTTVKRHRGELRRLQAAATRRARGAEVAE
ncbi:hypothetical protein DZF91_11270 [Actinomadura logoneensis]|uniref:Uncharacterized protein n=1 Tax=Actinomadura logoneensis TaxID=2293572 RepID=A0A372JNM1_9ACTN|nr:hypothetical protein [Actinomadura logoneensis]RFU41549.1 hypothetical protein DZF91_11270 [Actinomadura logoneensis]